MNPQQQTPPGVSAKMDPQPDHGEASYKGSGKLAGKAAIVTGGDSGIGRAIAIAFAREGADVLVAHLDEHPDAEATARWVRDAGPQAVLMPGDVQDKLHCRAIVARAVEAFGRLDILVNNAAFQMTRDSLEETPIRVNCVAPGPIWTPLIPSTMPAEQVESFGSEVPMKRPGQPAEVAPLFVYLASSDASYVTGATYAVTGGTDAAFAARPGKAVVVESFGLAGFGYHARDEYVELDSIVPRLYLMTRLLQDIAK